MTDTPDPPVKTARPALMSLDSPWHFDPGTVRLAAPADLDVAAVTQRLLNGSLDRPYIFETRTERALHFTHLAVQSRMDLADPDALVNEYTRLMMAFLPFNEAPAHILMIGLGGGSIPKFCHRHLRDTRVTVVEIDADVIALRDEFRVPPDAGRFRVVHADGAAHVAALEEPVDVMLIDAFDRDGIAPPLASASFHAQAAAHLGPDGILVMNLSGRRDRFAEVIGSVRAAFAGSIVLVPVGDNDNLLLYAFGKPVLGSAMARYQSRARMLESRLPLSFGDYLRRMQRGQVIA